MRITNKVRDQHPDGHLLSEAEIVHERKLARGIRKAPGEDVIAKLRAIVAEHAMMDVDGQIVDVQSANVVLTVHDSLTQEEARKKLSSYPVLKMIKFSFQVLDRVREGLRARE